MCYGKYYNSWEIFFVRCTYPYINEFITEGNSKINADWDADRLFSSALSLTRSDTTLSRSLSTTYEIWKPWDKRWRTTHLKHLVSNSLQQHPVQEHRCHFYACTNMLEHSQPWYERDRIYCEDHAPVMTIMPQLWVMPCYKPVACGYSKYCTCGAFNFIASWVIFIVRIVCEIYSLLSVWSVWTEFDFEPFDCCKAQWVILTAKVQIQ